MKKILVFLVIILAVSSFSVIPANANFNKKKTETLLNNRAVKLSIPVYPKEAKKAKIQGKVLVRIKVNEKGKVTEANMIEGSPLFKEATEKSALISTFKPKIINGKRVKYKGMLQYSFSIMD